MKEPVLVQRLPSETLAIQFTGDNAEAICAFVSPRNFRKNTPEDYEFFGAKHDNWYVLYQGIWVLRELDGSGFYPCAPEVFKATYRVKQKDLTESFVEGVEESRR